MLTGIDHINIVVLDLEACREFFVGLGFTVEHEDTLEGETISRVVGLDQVRGRYIKLALPGAETRIELMRYDHPPSE
ncbi:MAG: VOC family protein, partial [Verrucomicrobia bacterium]|nr:VOC family protein [Verrucomicrobiota bacterium]